ncbi:LacI family DNA-binding transcriptional regulator [Arthrobacter sp. CAN_C5]|uniref:LacI family DNA-binding transcriptional regulator n=1 Tax=Arthrobacter sp. CAN_C5 TaxID=2760706 RepID=UPI001AE7EB2B|nr:LacI family DNA-binding transcriptional regulator [Arthrobacter sp. CAN_C5]MBP2216932.1 LacI family transcriptional regulator [Arthrobacter sp. CAN_C5]
MAEVAGVHVSTVSRALRTQVNPAMHDAPSATITGHIIEVAERLGYRPDPYAASLRTQRTMSIGVLVPRLSDVVLATIYEGIEQFAATRGYQVAVANTYDDPERHQKYLGLMSSRRVDGLILADVRMDAAPSLPADIPTILVNRRCPDLVSVSGADVVGGGLVASHFADLGHRYVGVIAGTRWASTSIDRVAGFRDTLSLRGISVPDSAVVSSSFDVEGGREAARKLLALEPRPTAVFAVNDYAAIGAMGEMRDQGLMPGVDITVVGYNDINIARELLCSLSSVDNSVINMGRIAGQTLIEMLAGQPVASTLITPHLNARQSSGPPRR